MFYFRFLNYRKAKINSTKSQFKLEDGLLISLFPVKRLAYRLYAARARSCRIKVDLHLISASLSVVAGLLRVESKAFERGCPVSIWCCKVRATKITKGVCDVAIVETGFLVARTKILFVCKRVAGLKLDKKI